MTAETFLDTNVLVYAAVANEDEEDKRRRACELLAESRFGLSAQVLQEFYVVVTRKIDVPMTPVEALEWIEQFDAFPQVPIDRALIKFGIENSVRFGISYRDGAIVAAAEQLRVHTPFSEDLSVGQRYGSIRVVRRP